MVSRDAIPDQSNFQLLILLKSCKLVPFFHKVMFPARKWWAIRPELWLAQTVLQQRVFPPAPKQIKLRTSYFQTSRQLYNWFDFYINYRANPVILNRRISNRLSAKGVSHHIRLLDLRLSAMYSSSNRAQGVFGFFTTVAAFVAGFAALSVLLHPATDVTSSVDLNSVQVYVLCNQTLRRRRMLWFDDC